MAGYNQALLEGLLQTAKIAPVLEDQAFERQQRLIQQPLQDLTRQAQMQTLSQNMASAPEKAALDRVLQQYKIQNEGAQIEQRRMAPILAQGNQNIRMRQLEIEREKAMRAPRPANPNIVIEEDQEGRKWFVDKTGQTPPRPVKLGDGSQAIKQKDLTAKELDVLTDNATGVDMVERAMRLNRGESFSGMAGDKEATGLKGYVPDIALQRLDAQGVPTRSAISNVGSLKIKERSGGAVPAAEMERLIPFVPKDTDTQEAVDKKLKGFAFEYARILENVMGTYKDSHRAIPNALKKRYEVAIARARQLAGDHTSQPLPEHVDRLRAEPTPQMRAFFDEAYGAGAAAALLGQ